MQPGCPFNQVAEFLIYPPYALPAPLPAEGHGRRAGGVICQLGPRQPERHRSGCACSQLRVGEVDSVRPPRVVKCLDDRIALLVVDDRDTGARPFEGCEGEVSVR
jgi:hypothetical protein